MNKKILIGSIISITVLIGISFTSVVGYQSTSKTVAEISPLFNVISNRAIEKDGSIVTYNYVGQGEDAGISIPKRTGLNLLINGLRNIFNQMDNDQLKQLKKLALKQSDINKNGQMAWKKWDDLENFFKQNNSINDENFAEFERIMQNNKEVFKDIIANPPITIIPDDSCTLGTDLCWFIAFIALLVLSPIIIPVAIAAAVIIGVYFLTVMSLSLLFFIMYILLMTVTCFLFQTWAWGPL